MRSNTARAPLFGGHRSPDARMAAPQHGRQPQGHPEQAAKGHLGGLGRLLGDGSQQPADVEAGRAQHRVQRVAFAPRLPLASP